MKPTSLTTVATSSSKEKDDYYSQNSGLTKDMTFYYCVMPGNYPGTMRTVMNKRGNWTEVRR